MSCDGLTGSILHLGLETLKPSVLWLSISKGPDGLPIEWADESREGTDPHRPPQLEVTGPSC